MSVTEAHRLALLEAASHHWGRDVAATLIDLLPPSGWGDVATRQHLDALEARIERDLDHRFLAVDHRFQLVDQRFDALEARMDSKIDGLEARMDSKIDGLEARMDSKIASGHRQFIQWTAGTMIAMTGVFTAIVGVMK